MITRVEIDGYKSFKNFELEMKPLMVVFGPNASGKSNLLDALQLVSKAATEKNLKVAFEQHRGLPLESLSFYSDQSKRNQFHGEMKFQVDVCLGEKVKALPEKSISLLREFARLKLPKLKITEDCMRYKLSMRVGEAGETRVSEESLFALTKTSPPQIRKRKPFLETVGKKIEVLAEGESRYFEEKIGLDYTVVSNPSHYLIPHLSALGYELEGWWFYYLDPKTLMREDVPITEIFKIGPRGENLAGFFNTLKHRNPKQFDALSKALKLLIPDIDGIDLQTIDKTRVRARIRERSLTYNPALVSDGSIRMLGLLAILSSLALSTVIGYEEPENGVHPQRLKIIADMFKNAQRYRGIQCIITTHSSEFASLFDDENLFICRKDNGRTLIKALKEIEPPFRKDLIRESLRDPRM